MINNIPIEKILFLDVETVPQVEKWEELDSSTQKLWDKKTTTQRKDEVSAEEFYPKRAGIMAEFGKILCISIGMYNPKSGRLKMHSFYGDNEKEILLEFGKIFNAPRMQDVILCGHNGKEFDFPYIARRMLIQGIRPPIPLQSYGKKPWQVPHLDTMELWKFGDWKHYVSLELLAHLFGVPTPKDDIDGSMVADIYYIENDLERIKIYCEKDVITLCNVFRRMRQEELLEREN